MELTKELTHEIPIDLVAVSSIVYCDKQQNFAHYI